MNLLRKRTYWIFLIINLISLNSFAEDSIFLNAGDKAPNAGYLVPEATIKSLRNDSLDADMYRKIVPLKDQQLLMVTDQNVKLATTLTSTTSLSTLEKVGWFVGGIIVTGLATKLAISIYK